MLSEFYLFVTVKLPVGKGFTRISEKKCSKIKGFSGKKLMNP